jgi:tRNA pseudouridine38-40 synthase
MPIWKLTIEYDGTRYHGWQEQKNARTIAGELRKAAEEIFQARIEIDGAGRTDSGVHALGQVARLRANKPLPTSILLRELNDRLPADINILRVEEAPQKFHPRHDAIARHYLYQISTRRSAFAKKYVWWIRDSLDVDKMQQAAQLLPGKHDFSPFADKRNEVESTLVAIEKAEVKREGELILIRIGASHFLWKMVRRIVGTLVEVGRGKLPIAAFERLLQSSRHDTQQIFDIAAHTAPPSGLFLERIQFQKSGKPTELEPILQGIIQPKK